jgi:hypothetical protein
MPPSPQPIATPTAAPPEPLRLERQPDGRLAARRGGALTPVRPIRCFPWSGPATFVSLRDDKDREVALVTDPALLDTASRVLLEEELAHAGFVLRVTRIRSIVDELEIRVWRVDTRQGTRLLQTARDEWPRPLPSGLLLLRDVAGDLYLLPAPADLDPTSRQLLWPFTD